MNLYHYRFRSPRRTLSMFRLTARVRRQLSRHVTSLHTRRIEEWSHYTTWAFRELVRTAS